MASHATDTPGVLHSPWQKATVSWANHLNFFFFTTPLTRCLFWGMACRGELFERPLLPGSQRSETVWNIFFTNLCHFNCNFSPCLACDLARCQAFLGRLRKWDSLLLDRTCLAIVWPLSDKSPTTHTSFQRFWSSSILKALVSRTKLTHTTFPSIGILRFAQMSQVLFMIGHPFCSIVVSLHTHTHIQVYFFTGGQH